MATPRKTPRTVVIDALPEADYELTDELPALPTDQPEPDGDASLCPTCGEPLTWHEQACTVAVPLAGPIELPVQDARLKSGFAYSLGHLVLPTTQAQAHPVVWRGQLKERHPATGLVHRVNVYRLGDGHWDCYREEELQAA